MALRAHDLARDFPTVAATLANDGESDELLTATSTASSATVVASSPGMPGGKASGALGSSTGGGGVDAPG